MHLAQTIAAEAVNQVLAGRNLNEVLLALWPRYPQATSQQKAQAQHLSYGTLRFYLSLQALLNALIEKPLRDDAIASLLLVALYQLHYDQAPAHTVVNQAVMAVMRMKKVWAKGLVNAVLRNFSRQQVALVKALEQDQTTTLNYPAWWISKVQKQYPEHWQQILLTGNQHPPMTLRVNQSQLTGLAYQQKLQAANISSQLLDTQTLLLDQAIHVTDLPGFNEGEVSVQDYAAQMTARCLDAQANMRVLDACAAPGGKTCHILETAQVQMWALDVSEQRLARVNSNLQRLNLQAHTQVADVAKTDAWWDGQLFDRILLDAPCTASGVVRRHVDIKWLRRESDISSFAAQQKEMLQALWPLLKQGGKLLYVTCSIFAEENELQINNFLQTHADALHLPLLELPHNLQIQKGQFIPNEYHDGLFYALLQKH